MRRKIEVRAGAGVVIVATIDSEGHFLSRDEVERVRGELADRLQNAAAFLPYSFSVRPSKVKVL